MEPSTAIGSPLGFSFHSPRNALCFRRHVHRWMACPGCILKPPYSYTGGVYTLLSAPCVVKRTSIRWIYYYYLLLAYTIAQSTHSGSPQGFSLIQISHTNLIQYKTCTSHERKTCKHNPKGSPFGIALVKNGK